MEQKKRGGLDGGALLTGAGIGAGLMYLFDPDQGVERREMIRSKYEDALASFREEIEEELGGEEGEQAVAEHGGAGHVRRWTPATRMVASGAGLSLLISGLARRGVVGSAMAIGGAFLGLRALTDIPMRQLVGIGAGRAAVQLRKVVTVRAPVERVFRFWSRFENFPKFMEHIQDINVIDERRSHWKVDGPGGIPVEWDAEVTRSVPNKAFAWRTLPGAKVEHAGVVRFHRVGEDSTRLEIHMSYTPPAGAIGHTVAKLLGRDPKSEMDEDLERMKMLLEESTAVSEAEGKPPTRELQ